MRIFISYRRGPTADIVGRIGDRLAQHYGSEALFRDIDSIPPGVPFPLELERALAEATVLLAIIGPDWTAGDLHSPKDWVRQEIEAALRRRISIIPVLVGHVGMPPAEALPKSLQPLLSLQAVCVDSEIDFDVHARRLIGAIDKRLGWWGHWWGMDRARALRAVLGIALVGVAMVAGYSLATGGRPAAPISTAATVSSPAASMSPATGQDHDRAPLDRPLDRAPSPGTSPGADSVVSSSGSSPATTAGAPRQPKRPRGATALARAFEFRILSYCWRDFVQVHGAQPATTVHLELFPSPGGRIQNLRFHNLMDDRYAALRRCVVVKGTETLFTEPWSAPSEHVHATLR